jgi:DNA-binding NtrC family response regulator
MHCAMLNKDQETNEINTLFSHKQGTFFIKHVEYLSKEGQKTLLSKLHTYNKNNIKIIASACTSLFTLQQQQKFHAPLFYTLHITPIEIPPLNKRRYDIPLLVDHFLKKYNKTYAKNIILNTKSIRMLRNHDWHGNITQLKTFIKQIVYTTKTDNHILIPEDLLQYMNKISSHIIEEQAYVQFKTLEQAKDEFEKNFLLYYLKKNKYDTKQVLNQLDLTPVQLRDKLLKFNIGIKI